MVVFNFSLNFTENIFDSKPLGTLLKLQLCANPAQQLLLYYKSDQLMIQMVIHQ